MQRSFTSLSILLALAFSTQVTGQSIKTSAIERRDGLRVQILSLSVGSQAATARVYFPDVQHKVAAVVFSHSRIKSDQGETDLLPFAESVARAGAAVVVLDRTLFWRTGDDPEINRGGGAIVVAAEDWVLAQENVDFSRFAYVGPRFHNPNEDDALQTFKSKQSPSQHGPDWVPLGEPNGDSTRFLVDPNRRQRVGRFLEQDLQLDVVQ